MARLSPGRSALLIVVGAIGALAGMVAVLFFALSTLEVTSMPATRAAQELDRVRARFAGLPCVDRGRGQEATTTSVGPPPTAVHILEWEADRESLVRATTPYWALRAGSWKLSTARRFVSPLEHVDLVDLERCGRGLILDRTTPGGRRVLIWTE